MPGCIAEGHITLRIKASSGQETPRSLMGTGAAQALEQEVEAELQAERAAAEVEAARVKAAIQAKQAEWEAAEAAAKAVVRFRLRRDDGLGYKVCGVLYPLVRRSTRRTYGVELQSYEVRWSEMVHPINLVEARFTMK